MNNDDTELQGGSQMLNNRPYPLLDEDDIIQYQPLN